MGRNYTMKMSRGFLRWSSRVGLERKLAVGLAVASLASGIATYGALTGWPPFDHPNTILILLEINLVLGLGLGTVIARRLVEIWASRRRGLAGSQLHSRLVMLFSLVAVTPTIIITIFSYLFFTFGVQTWFSDQVRTALSESQAVAEAYLHEHQQVIRADVLAMAADLNHDATILSVDPQRLNQFVSAQAALRSLTEAVVFDSRGRLLARSGFSFTLQLEPVPEWAMSQARNGDVAILTSDNDDRVRALVRLPRFGDAYLYVGRFVEPLVLNHMERTQKTVAQYEKLEGERSDYQLLFALIFLVVALLFLLAAIWVGLNFATKMARPISFLISAAERVRAGDLSAQVPEGETDEEFGSLSRAFNRMTQQLQSQQSELIEANKQLDDRRRFTETVLSGVSAGVIGLDAKGHIHLPNRSASTLLETDLDQLLGRAVIEAVPEMTTLFEEAARRPDRLTQGQIQLSRRGRTHMLLVRIAAERTEGEVTGYVVTFDDVTELLSAQRKAAWADVARRIAHEIKNPLTPIQLSAERLKRKYLKDISNDPETFATCTDTIIRHVGDIGRMVDEFSSFARMPAPVMKETDLAEIARQAVFLQRNGTPEIRFELEAADRVMLSCDSRLVSQALVNLLKNAAESIQAREEGAPQGEITVRIQELPGQVSIAVEDNGKGLPDEDRERLTEPYVTTRTKGTGLGLAIVRKIMEDHGGELQLEDREGGGARVRLLFTPETRPRIDATDEIPAKAAV